jgi:hypothetical protein
MALGSAYRDGRTSAEQGLLSAFRGLGYLRQRREGRVLQQAAAELGGLAGRLSDPLWWREASPEEQAAAAGEVNARRQVLGLPAVSVEAMDPRPAAFSADFYKGLVFLTGAPDKGITKAAAGDHLKTYLEGRYGRDWLAKQLTDLKLGQAVPGGAPASAGGPEAAAGGAQTQGAPAAGASAAGQGAGAQASPALQDMDVNGALDSVVEAWYPKARETRQGVRLVSAGAPATDGGAPFAGAEAMHASPGVFGGGNLPGSEAGLPIDLDPDSEMYEAVHGGPEGAERARRLEETKWGLARNSQMSPEQAARYQAARNQWAHDRDSHPEWAAFDPPQYRPASLHPESFSDPQWKEKGRPEESALPLGQKPLPVIAIPDLREASPGISLSPGPRPAPGEPWPANISSRWVRDNIVEIPNRWGLRRVWQDRKTGELMYALAKIRCSRRVAPYLIAALDELDQRGLLYLVKSIDSYFAKYKEGGREPSPHSFGVAFDINQWECRKLSAAQKAERVKEHRPLPAQDPRLIAIMRKHGFACGQFFTSPYDPMHFEFADRRVMGVAQADSGPRVPQRHPAR